MASVPWEGIHLGSRILFAFGCAAMLAAQTPPQTPNIGLYYPAHGTYNWDTWYNLNWAALDALSGYHVLASAFGVKCDGVTNDTANLAKAIAYSAAHGNGAIQLPVGVCLANITLGDNQSIVGAGNGNLPGPGYGSTDIATTSIKSAASSTATITVGGDYAAIRNMRLYGSGSGAGDIGILINGHGGTNIEHVTCNNYGAECIRWDNGAAVRVSHVLAANTMLTRATSAYDGAIYFGSSATDGFLEDAEVGTSVNTHGAHSYSSNCYNAGVYIAGANHFIANSIGETSETGWVIASTLSRYVNIRGDLNYCQGARITGSGNTIVGSVFVNNGLDGAAAWEAILTSGANNTISSNIVYQQLQTVTYGFHDTLSSDANVNSYLGNTQSGSNPTVGLYGFAGFAGAAHILADKAAKTIADGTAAPNVGGGFTSWQFAQSTPITITTLNGGVWGQHIYLRGNSNVTLGSGGNIIPRYASTEALQASVLYEYYFDGTNWRELTLAPIPTVTPMYSNSGTSWVRSASGSVQLNASGSITVTFTGNAVFGTIPLCVGSDASGALPLQVTNAGTNVMSISGGASAANHFVNYICVGN